MVGVSRRLVSGRFRVGWLVGVRGCQWAFPRVGWLVGVSEGRLVGGRFRG